jgi:ribosome maturation factor RimP
MADKATDIVNLLSPTVEALGLELLGVDYLPSPGGAMLRLYIDIPADAIGDPDAPRMVGIEDCEAVSREVSAQLDVEDPISSHYTLEVSSPGVDRPLFTPAQFARFLGEQAKIGLKLPQDGRRKLQGRIVVVEGERIEFEVDAKPEPQRVSIAFDNIEKARLIPDWAALGFGPVKQDKPAKPGKKPVGRHARKRPAEG